MSVENDDWFPLEREEHEQQVSAVLSLLGEAGKRVIDIGAGGGRVAGALVERGHRVLAIDCDARAVEACAGVGAEARCVDVLDGEAALGFEDGDADAALLLGGTLAEIVDPRAGARAFFVVREVVKPGGWLALDGGMLEVWDDIAEGGWVTGVSEDGEWQLIWAPGDNVVAMRRGEAVDAEDWEIGEGDRLLRLWSAGELALLAEASGWGMAEMVDYRVLLRLERVGG